MPLYAKFLISFNICGVTFLLLIAKFSDNGNLDIWKIFGCILLLLVVFQFVVGTLLGVGIVGALNAFWMIIWSYDLFLLHLNI